MYRVDRALALSVESGRPLPLVPELGDLYRQGTTPRHGQTMMVVGRSGTQKSGFALWYADKLAIPTLYFSADMSPFTASARVASLRSGYTTEEIEKARADDPKRFAEIMEHAIGSKIQFNFFSPIRLSNIEVQLDAYVEVYDAYPELIVFDNLMDFEEAESDYSAQMQVMSMMTELSRDTGSSILLLHHASDKSWEAKTDPWSPPGRNEVKNGMSEKPELTLGVALNPYTMDYNVATIKQRMGKCDPTGRTFITLKAEPELTRFHAKSNPFGG